MPRYTFIAVCMTVLGIAIVGKAFYLMTVKHDYWMKVADRQKKDSVVVKPLRGNILSSDGQLMASSLPMYKIFMDFQAGGLDKDTLWMNSVDEICEGLNRIFPEKSVSEFKRDLEEGHRKMSRHWPVWNRRIDFNTFCMVKELPVFNLSPNRGGFHTEELASRSFPCGSLAQRTVGRMYGDKDEPYCGIELSYDSILRGTDGMIHRTKVMNKYLSITDTPPTDGNDVVTTIDVTMQDLAERALLEMLKSKEVKGEMGVVILMEVKTGDIKAIVNMSRIYDSNGEPYYMETLNNAVSYRCEPGSVFKVASILAAIDDGVLKQDTSEIIHTGGGVLNMHGRDMKDHNWRTQGGFQDINIARSLEVSSNIGVSWIIDKYYRSNPEKFVQTLDRIGIREDLHLPIVGYVPPIIRMPHKNSRGNYDNWSSTALPWMSIGYETQIAPINTVAFYNAIANDGKMMRPRFVKAVQKDGEIIQEFPPEVIKERIAKPASIKKMQTILRHVVSQGLGKKAGSDKFEVSGKTGTAQVSQGSKGYTTGTVGYWLSFAGYFPSNAPEYSMIVCIKKSGLPASGGGMSGVVFRHIAEGVMAKKIKRGVDDAADSASVVIPDVKHGNLLAADYVLNHLGVTTNNTWDGNWTNGNPIWGTARRAEKSVELSKQQPYGKSTMPDVVGMGARDAVYMLESRGMRVKIEGRGKVQSQSVLPGRKIQRKQLCVLRMG